LISTARWPIPAFYPLVGGLGVGFPCLVRLLVDIGQVFRDPDVPGELCQRSQIDDALDRDDGHVSRLRSNHRHAADLEAVQFKIDGILDAILRVGEHLAPAGVAQDHSEWLQLSHLVGPFLNEGVPFDLDALNRGQYLLEPGVFRVILGPFFSSAFSAKNTRCQFQHGLIKGDSVDVGGFSGEIVQGNFNLGTGREGG